MAGSKKIRLDNPRMARRFLIRLINQYNKGDITTEQIKTLTNTTNSVVRIMEGSEIAQKINQLEEKIRMIDI